MSLTIVLSDNANWRKRLYPFTSTRPVGNIRSGICTLDEKWSRIFQSPVTYDTVEYLNHKFPFSDHGNQDFLIIRANVLPSDKLVSELKDLRPGEVLLDDTSWVAIRSSQGRIEMVDLHLRFSPKKSSCKIEYLRFLEDIYLKNKTQLLFDFNLLTTGRNSAPIDSSNSVYGNWIFVEEGAQIQGASLNSLEGPIYIGKNSKIEEGSFLKGYVAIGEGVRVKTGARLYPNTTIGPQSTICGEVNNTVIWGNSTKGHEGYLGCSVLGQGCNMGAGSSNSNLKNNWKPVRLFDYEDLSYRETDEIKCGLFFGDFAMCGINSSFTTGCVIGVGSQVAISKFIPKFVADFSWMTDAGTQTYTFDKFIEMMERRDEHAGRKELGDNIAIFNHIFEDVKYIKTEQSNLNI